MGIITYDAVDEIKSLLKTKWSSIRPPMVSAIWDKRTVGFMDDTKDQLIIYPKDEVINYFGLNGSNFWHEQILELENNPGAGERCLSQRRRFKIQEV